MTVRAIGQRYLVTRTLGESGASRVFLCWDQRLQVWCAVRVLSECACASGSCSSPARSHQLVRIFDVVDDGASPYVVTEYVDGGSPSELGRLHPSHAARPGPGRGTRRPPGGGRQRGARDRRRRRRGSAPSWTAPTRSPCPTARWRRPGGTG